jgi:hypothetical protein
MAGKYVNVSRQEMESFLFPLGFQIIPVEVLRSQGEYTVELVYGKRVHQGNWPLTLRVYSGIWPSGESRDVGRDAIRVDLFLGIPNGTTEEGKPQWKVVKLGGAKRVHRIAPSSSNPEGWRSNLRIRIESWSDYLPKSVCPNCGNPMVLKEGKYGKFLACVTYPTCKNTKPIRD